MTTNRSHPQSQQEQPLSAVNSAAQNVLRTSNATVNAFLGYPRKSWMNNSSSAVPAAARSQATQPAPAARPASQRKGPPARAVNRQNGSSESSQQPPPSTLPVHSSVPHSPAPMTTSEAQQPRLSSFSNSPLVANLQVSQPPSSVQSTQASTLPSPAPSTEQLPSPRYTGEFENEPPRHTTAPEPASTGHRSNSWPTSGAPTAPPVTQPMETAVNGMREIPAHRNKRPRLDTTNQFRPVAPTQRSVVNGPPANGQMNQHPPNPGDQGSYSLPSVTYLIPRLLSYAQSVPAQPPGDVSQPRFHLLNQACQKEDRFYLALHQVFCLRTANPAMYSNLPRFGLKQEVGLQIIEKMLVSNNQMPKNVVQWCAAFPAPIHGLLEHSPPYRTSIDMVISFLELVAQHWDSFDAEIQRRGYPPLIDELVSIFATPSSVLHSVMFKALLRRLCGWNESQTRHFESVFQRNQDIYARRMRLSGSGHPIHPSQTQFENDHLISAYQNLRALFLQGIQNPSAPNVAATVGQNQPSNPGRPAPTLNTQYLGGHGNGSHSPTAQAFSQPSVSHPNYPSQLAASISPTHTTHPPMQPNGARAVPSQTRFVNNHQQQRILPSQIVNHVNNAQRSQAPPPNPRQPLLPPAHSRSLHLANPDPSIQGLHQAHLKSPVRKYASLSGTGGNEESAEYFQYIQSFAFGPHHLGRTDPWYDWEFTLSADNMQKLPTDSKATATQPASRVLADGSVMYRLRCSKVEGSSEKVNESTWALSETAWPSCIYIYVNGTELFVRRKLHHGKDLPLDISNHVKEGANTVSFGFLRTPAEKERILYALAVEVVEVGTLDRVRGVIETLSRAKSLEQIKARMSPSDDDDDIAIVDDYITIDLIDPFTAKVFEVPARSKECTHRECFDLATFLKTRLSKSPVHKNGRRTGHDEDWKCPICARDARPQLLIIDGFLSSVQSELKTSEERLATTRAIRVRADGSWEGKAEKETNGTGNSGGGTTNNGTPAATSERSTSINQDKQSAPAPSITTTTTSAPSHEVIEID